MNDLMLRALRGEEVERPPVWMMRQAGRTLPEYRAVRAEVGGFKDLLMNPDRAAEVTLQPIDAYGVDAAILFSDILVVPEAMGLPYNLVEKVGPRFPETIRSRRDLDRLHDVDPERDLKYVLDAVRIILRELDGRVPLIGFAGAPWTLFCYMVEGKGSKDWPSPGGCCGKSRSCLIPCCRPSPRPPNPTCMPKSTPASTSSSSSTAGQDP